MKQLMNNFIIFIKKNKLSLLLLCLFFIVFVILENKTVFYLKVNERYTVGEITKKTYGSGNNGVKFIFNHNGDKKTSWSSTDNR